MPAIAATSSTLKKSRNKAVALANAFTSAVDSRLAGKSAGSALSLFVGYNTTTPVNTRNASAWCADVDLTPISTWNSHGKHLYGGILIAPDVMIYAHHAEHPDGTVFNFVKMDGTLVQRTQTSRTFISGTDIGLAKLSSDVGSGISFAKVLPSQDFIGFSNRLSLLGKVPAIGLDQQEKATVRDTSSIGSAVSFQSPSDSKRLEFYEALVDGDSGSPACWIYETSLVIACTWYSGGGGSGPSIHANRAAINAAMTSLGSPYQLSEITL